MRGGTSGTEAWYIEKGTQMTSFHYPADLQYELQARYPENSSSIAPERSRSALRINLEVWRARRAENQGR
jgi:uncharacterized protein (DUF2249 family)